MTPRYVRLGRDGRSQAGAAVYEHVETTEETQKADLLPGVSLGEIREKPPRKAKS